MKILTTEYVRERMGSEASTSEAQGMREMLSFLGVHTCEDLAEISDEVFNKMISTIVAMRCRGIE